MSERKGELAPHPDVPNDWPETREQAADNIVVTLDWLMRDATRMGLPATAAKLAEAIEELKGERDRPVLQS
ncbi:hypothetical protein [Pyruvatibacter sp.]